MKTPQTLLALAVLAVTVSACEQADPEPAAPAYSAAVEQALGGMEFSRAPGLPMDVLIERVNVAVSAMYEVSGRAKTWQDAHALAQEQIRRAEPGVTRATVEQSMAKLMLVGYLVPNRQDPEAAGLALDYARSLVERGSPEAEVVLEAAQTFGSEWAPADLRAVAVGAADAVEAHVNGGTVCHDCELPAKVRRALAERGQTSDVVTIRRLDAARQLRALAEPRA